MIIEVGSTVRATVPVVEGDIDPCPEAAELEAGWVHAQPGDIGKVEFIEWVRSIDGTDEAAGITVRFDRSGTASMLFAEELELVPAYAPEAGDLVEHETYGLGKVVHVDARRIHVFFRDVEGSDARAFGNPAGALHRSATQTDPILDNTPPFTLLKGRWSIPGNRMTFEFALQKFLKQFPRGFADPAYAQAERDYKWAAHQLYVEKLGNGQLAAMVEAGAGGELGEALTVLMQKTNLTSQYETMAFRDGVRDPDAALAYGRALIAYLHKQDRASFDGVVNALNSLPVEAGKSSPVSWPNATYFAFFADPTTHMFFKPLPTKAAAEAFGFELNYRSAPSYDGYQRLIEFADAYALLLESYGARDYIDVQSFLWLAPR